MMQSDWPRRFRSISLAGACALAAAMIAAPGSVRAQSDDTTDSGNALLNLERRIWSGFVRGLGLRSADDPVIQYRERSPLVVPPSRDLPPPQAKAAPRDPAWPVDPDVKRAKQRAQVTRTVGNDRSRVYDRQGTPLSPDELSKGKAAPGTTASTGTNAPASGTEGAPLRPSELGYFGGLFTLRGWGFAGYQNETGTFTEEPPRAALTAPPSGYQTPSPEQPYGTTKRVERAKPKQFDPAGEYAR